MPLPGRLFRGGFEGVERECGGDGLLECVQGSPVGCAEDSPGFDVGDGTLDDLADPVDALVLLPGRLAQFAVGGFLCGVIIPLPTYPLSAIHPEGSIPSSSPETPGVATSCMDPG